MLIVGFVHHITVESLRNIFNFVSDETVFVFALTLFFFVASTTNLERLKVFCIIFTTQVRIFLVSSAAISVCINKSHVIDALLCTKYRW